MNDLDLELEKQLLELRGEFLDGLAEQLDQVETFLVATNGKKPGDIDFSEVVRIVHSAKGAGGTYGLSVITDLCHQFEDDLVDLQRSDSAIQNESIDGLLSYIDLQRQVIRIAKGDAHVGDAETAALSELWQGWLEKRQTLDNKQKVLVVDNSRMVSGLIRDEADTAHLTIDYVKNGYDALGRLLTKSYDFLVTGNNVPVLSGEAIIAALRLSDKQPQPRSFLVVNNKKRFRNKDSAICPDYLIERSAQIGKEIGGLMAENSKK